VASVGPELAVFVTCVTQITFSRAVQPPSSVSLFPTARNFPYIAADWTPASMT
jgi:hypothetical protein